MKYDLAKLMQERLREINKLKKNLNFLEKV